MVVEVIVRPLDEVSAGSRFVQFAAHRFGGGADLLHGFAQAFFGDAEFFRPIAAFLVFGEVDARAVQRAAVLMIFPFVSDLSRLSLYAHGAAAI
jgi:hypothetical protein